VLKRLSDHDFTLNVNKCILGAQRIEVVGHTLSADGISPLQSNVKAIMDLQAPANKKELQSLLGSFNYYGRFIPQFADLTCKLRTKTREEAEWSWDVDDDAVLDNLKKALASPPVLAFFDTKASKTILSCDASDTAIAAVLSQVNSNGLERPVAYASRVLTSCEKNYSVGEKEALACIWGAEHYHFYLYGRRFLIRTDHSSLTSLLTSSGTGKRPLRIQRWYDRLLQYNFSVVYRPGRDNALPDLLSRCTRQEQPTGMVTCHYTSEEVLAVGQLDELEFISTATLLHATLMDETLMKVVQYVRNGWPMNTTGDVKLYHQVCDELSVCNAGYLVRGERAVIPFELRSRVLNFIHAGHQGIVKCKQRGRSTVWWPGIDKDIEKLCTQCEACVLTKYKPNVPPLEPIELPKEPWIKVSIDIFGPIVTAPPNYRYLIVVIDMLSGWPEVHGVSQVTTRSVIQFFDALATTWGYPKEILSDNGSQFSSAEFDEFCCKRAIQHLRAAVYTPTTNGKVERFNQEIKQALKRAQVEGRTISDALQCLLFQYRSTPHSLTGCSPAKLMMGRELRGPLSALALDNAQHRSLPAVNEALQRARKKQQAYKHYYDRRHHARDIQLQIGEFVKKKRPFQNHKLALSWSQEIYVVTHQVRPYTYRLNDGSVWNIRKLLKVRPSRDNEDTLQPGDIPPVVVPHADHGNDAIQHHGDYMQRDQPDQANDAIQQHDLNVLRRSERVRRPPNRLTF
jgi:transposase InsO family protein